MQRAKEGKKEPDQGIERGQVSWCKVNKRSVEREETGEATEARPQGSQKVRLGFYSKCNGKSLKGFKQGNNMI